MPVSVFSAIAQSSAERLLNSAIEGVVLAFLAWLVLRFVPRQNAGTRFSVWMAVLLSIATLPLAEAFARVDHPVARTDAHAPLAIPASWGTVLFVAWATIALFLLARVADGIFQLRRLRNSAEQLEFAALDPQVRATLAEFQEHRSVSLCVSDQVSVPTAVGLFRPAVVLPRWALTDFPADDLNSVLVHELARLRRRDDWTNLLQKLVRAVFFFHPAVWWVEKRLSLEREMACDEHVLANTANPRAYAECLVSLAERGFLHRAVMLAQGAVHRLRDCSMRVRQILSGPCPQTARASRLALVAAASGSVLLLATFAQAPSLVVFRSPAALASAPQPPEAHPTDSNPEARVVPTTWHPQSQVAPPVVPATYAANRMRTQQVSREEKTRRTTPVAKTNAATQGTTPRSAAPLLHRASLTQPTPQAVSGTLVMVRETQFYTDGSQVWAVSIYRLAVLQALPAAPKEISRKVI